MRIENVPKSVAIIPDGNRRCARRLMLQPWKGHEWGAGKVREVFGWCRELGIREMSFYTLSLENLESRPKTELNYLFKVALKELKEMNTTGSFVHKNKVRLHFFGELSRLPKEIQEQIGIAMEGTRKYRDFRINYAVAYGGRQEILSAVRKLAAEHPNPEDITEHMLRHSMQTNGSLDPDLIIRTGGEKRLSNFLLYQSAYAELAFLDTFWPDLKREQFVAAIRDFSQRKRRFGK
jgi:tritrans,polycis-undecaprenyl-diphosphate synthase [geranylgeranyl-diphosphate specific]